MNLWDGAFIIQQLERYSRSRATYAARNNKANPLSYDNCNVSFYVHYTTHGKALRTMGLPYKKPCSHVGTENPIHIDDVTHVYIQTTLCWHNTGYVMFLRAKRRVVMVRLHTLSSWLPKHEVLPSGMRANHVMVSSDVSDCYSAPSEIWNVVTEVHVEGEER